MKARYNLISINFKAPIDTIKDLASYQLLIKSFRDLQDSGLLVVEYFENQEKVIVEDD